MLKWIAQEIETLRALNGSGEYIFSTSFCEKLTHDSTISSVICQIARSSASGSETFHPSDIRRTVETRLRALGVSREVRAQLLSHECGSEVQARHYERHDYLPEKTAALEAWEAYIRRLLRA